MADKYQTHQFWVGLDGQMDEESEIFQVVPRVSPDRGEPVWKLVKNMGTNGWQIVGVVPLIGTQLRTANNMENIPITYTSGYIVILQKRIEDDEKSPSD